MISFTSSQLDAWLAYLIWPLIRISGLMLVEPMLSNRGIPLRARAAIALMLTFTVAPLLPTPPQVDYISAQGLLLAAQQLLIGITLGFVIRIVLAGIEMAGHIAGLTMGLGFASFFDPQSGAQSPVLAQMQPDDPRRALTYGYNFRLEPDAAEAPRSKVQTMLEYAVYRAWLTPSDVSNRWYQYFIYVQKEPLGLRNFFPARGGAATEAPSRAVGLWAYRARFPHKYWDTISAYASFDADAFAHGGIPGVAVAVILLVLARVGAAYLLTAHPVGLASYGVFLSALAILPSSASLQAIFGANGLFIVLLVLLGIRLLAYAAKGKAGVAGGSL